MVLIGSSTTSVSMTYPSVADWTPLAVMPPRWPMMRQLIAATSSAVGHLRYRLCVRDVHQLAI
jgi:hypothetical protein